jgi:hypothetical protein
MEDEITNSGGSAMNSNFSFKDDNGLVLLSIAEQSLVVGGRVYRTQPDS